MRKIQLDKRYRKLAIAGVIGALLLVAFVAWGVELSPYIQAPKAVLIAGIDPDSGAGGQPIMLPLSLTAEGLSGGGGLVGVVHGRNSVGNNQVINTGDFATISGAQGMSLAVTPYFSDSFGGLYRASDASFGENLADSLPASASYVFDGTNWDRARSSAVGDAQTVGIPAGAGYGYNGASWDRLRATIANGLSVDPTRLPYVQADNTANPANKLPVLGAKATAAAPAWAEGRIVPLSTDLSGAVRTLATIAPTSYSYRNMYSTDNVVIVKSGPGVLHTIAINTSASLEQITWTVYDNTSAAGTKIATIYVPESWPNSLTYDVAFQTGLTIKANPLGGGASNITVSYK